MARAYFHANNLRDGIELVGGPSSFEDYIVKDDSLTYSGAVVTYVYKRPFSIPADPDRMKVTVDNGGGMGLEDVPICITPAGRERFHLARVPHDRSTREFLAQMPILKREPIVGCPDDKAEIITVDIGSKIKVARAEPPICNIHSVKSVDADTFKVYFNLHYSSRKVFEDYVDIQLCYEKKQWKLNPPEEAWGSKTSLHPLKTQEFLLYGAMSDEHIVDVIGLLVETVPQFRISAMFILGDVVYISFGQLKHDLRFGSIALNQPRSCVTYERRAGKWIPTCMASVGYAYPNYFMTAPSTQLFFPKDSVPQVKNPRDHVKWEDRFAKKVNKNLTDDDLRNIYSIAVRFRGFEFSTEIWLEMDSPDKIEVISDYGGPFRFYLGKQKERWVVNWLR